MNILNRLQQQADLFARELGCGGYDTRLAKQDFIQYLQKQPDPDYPPWGARAEFMVHIQQMQGQSGTGNPLSPLYIVGSEFNAEPDNYQELYFKYCFDLLWKEVFGIEGSDIVRHRVRQAFIRHWGGAGDNDAYEGYAWAPYYKSLRYRLMGDAAIWSHHPFVARHMDWHSVRGTGQQWAIASSIIKWILTWPVKEKKGATEFSSKGEAADLCCTHFSDKKIDDFVFLTESSLIAAADGVNKKATENDSYGFLDYALQNFKQPRIFLLNPSAKENLRKNLIQKYKQQSQIINEWYVGKTNPLSLWKHISGCWIISSPQNLTSSVSNELKADIIRLLRKAARKL